MFELRREKKFMKRIISAMSHKIVIKLWLVYYQNPEFQEKLNKIAEIKAKTVRRTRIGKLSSENGSPCPYNQKTGNFQVEWKLRE